MRKGCPGLRNSDLGPMTWRQASHYIQYAHRDARFILHTGSLATPLATCLTDHHRVHGSSSLEQAFEATRFSLGMKSVTEQESAPSLVPRKSSCTHMGLLVEVTSPSVCLPVSVLLTQYLMSLFSG